MFRCADRAEEGSSRYLLRQTRMMVHHLQTRFISTVEKIGEFDGEARSSLTRPRSREKIRQHGVLVVGAQFAMRGVQARIPKEQRPRLAPL
jgi:hypothetical protein